jgi:hypothetical protein
MSETIRRSGSPYGPDGPSSADIIRSRLIANGLKFTEDGVQAAAKSMDESLESRLKTKPPSEPLDEEIDDAWEQDREEKAVVSTAGDWIDDFKSMDWSWDLGQEQDEEKHEPWKPPEESAPAVVSKTAPASAAPTPAVPPTPAEVVEEAIQTASNHRELRQDCPSFWINKKLANCPEIRNDTELKAIGLLNSLMQKHGYAYVTNEQFAVWMKMQSESARHLLARLTKRGLIKNIDRQRDRIKWVVRQDLQNPKRERH